MSYITDEDFLDALLEINKSLGKIVEVLEELVEK